MKKLLAVALLTLLFLSGGCNQPTETRQPTGPMIWTLDAGGRLYSSDSEGGFTESGKFVTNMDPLTLGIWFLTYDGTNLWTIGELHPNPRWCLYTIDPSNARATKKPLPTGINNVYGQEGLAYGNGWLWCLISKIADDPEYRNYEVWKIDPNNTQTGILAFEWNQPCTLDLKHWNGEIAVDGDNLWVLNVVESQFSLSVYFSVYDISTGTEIRQLTSPGTDMSVYKEGDICIKGDYIWVTSPYNISKINKWNGEYTLINPQKWGVDGIASE